MTVFSKGSLEFLCQFKILPSIVVTNDWFTGLVPNYKFNGQFGNTFEGTSFIHVFHNLTYDGKIYADPNKTNLFERITGVSAHYLKDPY